MEVYLARGYETGSSAIALNPALMYSLSLMELHDQQGHHFRAYYPVKLDWRNRDPETNTYESPNSVGPYGIFVGDLDLWSQGGNQARGDGNNASTFFWETQIVQPTTVVEWYADLYPIPLNGVTNDTFSADLLTVLNSIYPAGVDYVNRYLQEFGVTPNCVLTQESPMKVQCPRVDLIHED